MGKGLVKDTENVGRRPAPAAGHFKSLTVRFVGSRPKPHPIAETCRFSRDRILKSSVHPRLKPIWRNPEILACTDGSRRDRNARATTVTQF